MRKASLNSQVYVTLLAWFTVKSLIYECYLCQGQHTLLCRNGNGKNMHLIGRACYEKFKILMSANRWNMHIYP